MLVPLMLVGFTLSSKLSYNTTFQHSTWASHSLMLVGVSNTTSVITKMIVSIWKYVVGMDQKKISC